MKNNPYTHYYLEQQGRGMPIFRGSPWQMGQRLGQRLGNNALNTGANFASDVLAGKNVKQAAKARALEDVNTARTKAAQRLQRYAQTGQGRKPSRSTRRPTKKRKASASASRRTAKKRKTPPTKRKAKKRKASISMTGRKQTKRPRTSPRDIFG